MPKTKFNPSLPPLNSTDETRQADFATTSTHAPATPPACAPGDLIGPFRVLGGPIGSGGMGAVFPAEDTTLGRKVALKLVSGEYLADARASERFTKEARTLASLNHPNIVTLYSFGETAHGFRYLAMELVEGETLAAVIRRGRLPQATVARYLGALIQALRAAHEKGIIHRDIKPSNVLIGPRDVIKLVDFGIATPLFSNQVNRLTQTGSVIGTIHYLPPEIFDGSAPNVQTDVYSLGLVAYEMLTGKMPLVRTSLASILRAIQTEEIPPPSRYAPLSPEWDAFVLQMCAKSPAERFRDVDEVEAALENLDRPSVRQPAASPPPRRAAPPTELTRRPRERGSSLWIILGALALVVAGAAAWFFLQEKPEPTPVVQSAPTECATLVATTPPGAVVFVNGREIGKSPVTVRGECGKALRLKLVLDGYAGVETTLTPDANQRQVGLEMQWTKPPPTPPPPAAPTPAAAPKARRARLPVKPPEAKAPAPTPAPIPELSIAQQLYDHGRTVYEKGLYRVALDDFRKSRSVSPSFAPAWRYELRALTKLKRAAEAREVAAQFVKRVPTAAGEPEVAAAFR